MIFEQSPKIYKRISQGLAILSVVCTIGVGSRLIKRDYNPLKRRIPLTVAAASLALFYNVQYKRLENKLEEKNNEN